MGKSVLSSVLWLLVSACTPVYADSIYVGGWSKHTSEIPGYKFNTEHSMLALEYNDYVVGHFYNSYYDSTWFASKRFNISTMGDFSLKLHVGITYGYKSCEVSKPDKTVGGPAVYCPMIVPEISYDKYMVRPTFAIIGNAFVVTFKINIGSW